MKSAQHRHTVQLPRNTTKAFVPRFAAPLGLILALSLPGIAQAVSIGELVLQSRLGEPFHAKVGLTIDPSETVDADCLSLSVPADTLSPDEFLTQANLTLHNEKGISTVLIQGKQPLNNVFIRVQLQVRCPGQGSISRTFIALPSPEISSPDLPDTASLIQSPTSDSTLSIKNKFVARTETARPKKPRRSNKSNAKPAHADADRPAPISRKAAGEGEFRLLLSTRLLDTAGSKLSDEERAKLPRLLDMDDRTAEMLALQYQVKQLQSELNEMRMQMKMSTNLPGVASPSSAPVATPTKAAPAVATSSVWDDISGLFSSPALALVAILLLLIGLRQYNKRTKPRWNDDPSQDSAHDEAALFPSNLAKVTPTVVIPPKSAEPAPPAATTPTETSVPKTSVASDTAKPIADIADAAPEADWVIEEAELYAVHGHPELAIQILEKLLDQSPDKPQAWLLLLSILSSLDRKPEFESAARRFAAVDGSRTYWKEVQALGQRIDKDNPLYFGEIGETHEPVPLAKVNRRPLGAILLDTGALTEEVLMGVLASFNPKRDGRIGAFLVKHGLISNEQLENALQIQRMEREADAA